LTAIFEIPYVIGIAWDRVQYEIYLPSSDIFVSLFSESLGEENKNNKEAENGSKSTTLSRKC